MLSAFITFYDFCEIRMNWTVGGDDGDNIVAGPPIIIFKMFNFAIVE